MSDATDLKSEGGRPGRHFGRLVAGAMLAGSLLAGVAIGPDVGASEAAVTQSAQCVRASNLQHVMANRATLWLIFVWAKGSNAYIGTLLATSSLREGPAGTWTMVSDCGPGGTTTTTAGTTTTTAGTTTTTAGTTTTTAGTTTTTAGTTTTTAGTTTTTAGPNGQAIYQQNCAVCHGADGSGGVGPSLQGIGDHHSRDELIGVVTNGRGGMPAFAGRLTPEQIGAVVDYIRTFPGGHEHDH